MTLDTRSAAPVPAEAAHAIIPAAQGAAGDAASAGAIRRLSHALAGGPADRKAAQTQRKAVDKLKTALAAIRQRDYELGARRALDALQLDERNGLAWHILAICREKSGHLVHALNAYEAAIQLLPDENAVAHDLGRLAQRLGYLDIAEKLLLKFLSVEPGHIDATNNLACVMRDQQRYDAAVQTLSDLIQVEPGSPILWNALGTVLADQGRSAESLPFFDEALRLDPGFAKARYNRANSRLPLGDPLGALEDLDGAQPGAEPGYEAAMMQMSRALLLLGMGRLVEGFEAYEIRLDRHMPDAMQVATPLPRWPVDRTDFAGRRLLVVGEQGLADEMVFGTCLADLIAAVGSKGRVVVAVEPRLVEMFQRNHPRALVGAHKAVRLEGRLTRYMPFVEDLLKDDPEALEGWIPLGSLMAPFRRSVDDFPTTAGYLAPDPERVARWRGELEALGPGLKVGLHWKSLVLTGVRTRYFSAFQRWEPVLSAPGCVMVNLQCGDVVQDLAEAEAAGLKIWTPPINLKDDLDDLAALSVALDVVIGPGIAGTNLAAAAGARTWMIQAPDDWRRMATDRYPVYPGLRLFETGGFDGWPRAIAAIRAALDEAVAQGLPPR